MDVQIVCLGVKVYLRGKSGQVKSSQNWSSLVKTGQVSLEQFKSRWDRSSQVRTGQVNLGQVKSSWDR